MRKLHPETEKERRDQERKRKAHEALAEHLNTTVMPDRLQESYARSQGHTITRTTTEENR